MTIISGIRVLALLAGLSISAQALASIEIFTLMSRPIAHRGNVVPCIVDQGASLRESINLDVANGVKPEQLQGLFQALSHVTLCRYRAKTLGIEKLPAIVFDGKYVIYGVDDLIAAQEMMQGVGQ